jgi:hypothetical protein
MPNPDAVTEAPVFFDPTGRRRRSLRAAVAVAAGGACTLAAGVAIGLTAPAQAPPASVPAPAASATAGPTSVAVGPLAAAAGVTAPGPATGTGAAPPSPLQTTKRLSAHRGHRPRAGR